MAALGIVGAGFAYSYLQPRPAIAVVDQASETSLVQGLKIFSSPDGTGTSLGTASGNTKPVCEITGTPHQPGPVIGVTDPGITDPGYVALPDSAGRVIGLPDCATIPSFPVTITTPQTSGNCPQYDYQCEQQQADQSCHLTADQQAESDQTDLERLYQQLLYKALVEQAAAKTNSTLLQQWLSGHTAATPADITELIKQSAITPLDVALAAAQALRDLDEQTHRYAKTTCTDSSNNTPSSSQANQHNDDPADIPGTASHPLQEVNPQAADPSVRMSWINPQDYVIRNDNELLYREDDRSPNVIFEESFQPKNTGPAGQYDLINKGGLNDDGPYVSTTRLREWPLNGTQPEEKYLYVLDTAGGIDMNATVGVRDNNEEEEVVFPGGIKTEKIIGAYEYKFNRLGGYDPVIDEKTGNQVFITNQHYTGTRKPS